MNITCARAIKQFFDQKHHPTWHVIVGSSFGSGVIHESRKFIVLEVQKKEQSHSVLCVLLFKAGIDFACDIIVKYYFLIGFVRGAENFKMA